jgi:predicted HicB family RNase H-like nuclease
MNLLDYKGYVGVVEFNANKSVLAGTIRGIEELITFEASEAGNIEKAFHSAVDKYLAACAEKGKKPARAFSGKFNVRIGATLHRKINLQAIKEGISLNQCVINAIEEYCKKTGSTEDKHFKEEISKPVSAGVEEAPIVAKPEQVAVEEIPIVAKPEPAAVEERPIVAKPEPAAVEERPIVAKPEPVAVEEAPIVAKPEPVAVEQTPNNEVKKGSIADKLNVSVPNFDKMIEDFRAGRLTSDDDDR